MLVLVFVQVALVLAKQRNFTGRSDHENRDTIGPGTRNWRHRICETRPGCYQRNAGRPRDARISIGHERGTLFMAGHVRGDFSTVVKCIVQRQIVDAGNPECMPDAPGDHRLNDHLAGLQTTWTFLAIAAYVGTLLVVQRVPDLARYKWTFFMLGAGLLLLPMVPGVGRSVGGARIWVRLGPINFQPGEFAKILLVIFLAGYLRERREVLAAPTRKILGVGVPALRHSLPLLIIAGASLVLLVAMNDLGSSLLFYVIALAMLYIATGRLLFVGLGAGLFALGAAAALQITPRVQTRIDGWLHPWADEQAQCCYQITQSIYPIADGGVLGAGFGRGLILNSGGGTIIPYAQTDFIYSVIANEMGLVGATAVILLYLLLAWRGFRIATVADDGFSKLLAAGLATAVAFQVFVIVGGVIRLLPLTGLTLPFVSYGGSSVTANFAIAGLLLCISQRANRERA